MRNTGCPEWARALLSTLLAICTFTILPVTVFTQSTTAAISGIVYDPSHAIVPDALVTVKRIGTSIVRQTSSDSGGTFRLTSLPPDRYEVTIERNGFHTLRTEVLLPLDEDVRIENTLTLDSMNDVIEVGTNAAAIDTSATAVGRRITGVEASELPVQGRLFLDLAKLAPGIVSSYNTGPSGSGFATAGQTGRNNTLMIDGLTLDDAQTSSVRGSLPLDAIQEFVVVTNAPTAEFGQASGAIVNILTKSGTNTVSGLGFALLQNGAWNATPGSAVLVDPPLPKPDFGQVVAGGSLGGPIVPQRGFFFVSVESTDRRSTFVVTSPVAQTIAPNESLTLPQRSRRRQVFGRIDWNVGPSRQLVGRYRLDRETLQGQLFPEDLDRGTPSRAFDGSRNDHDAALIGTFVLTPSLMDEVHFQAAGRNIDLDAAGYCAGCKSIEYPQLSLGKNPGIPNHRHETRWQVRDTLTVHGSGRSGDHTLKGGIDVSVVAAEFDQLINGDGTFTFKVDSPFTPSDMTTYPTGYTHAEGASRTAVDDRIAAAFVQDRWVPVPGVALNLGVRWDHESAIGVSHDTNNFAPRIAAAVDPWRTGRASIRGSYGLYYDQVYLGGVARNALQAARTITISNPGYQGIDGSYNDDPFGANSERATRKPDGLTRPSQVATPYTEQATVGFQRALGTATSLAIDAVWTRGQHLLVTHDLNYPTGLSARPDPNVGKINTFQSTGHSWYRGLQIGIARTASRSVGYSVAYTLSTSVRDTEDGNFVPQDQENYAADRGPSLNDVRHQLAGSWLQDLPLGIRLSSILSARSGLPYNVVVGTDVNGDGNKNDRPPLITRNSGRGPGFIEWDLRLTKAFGTAKSQLEFTAEVLNVTNRRNWTYGQSHTDGTPLRPSGADIPRQLQLGLRARF